MAHGQCHRQKRKSVPSVKTREKRDLGHNKIHILYKEVTSFARVASLWAEGGKERASERQTHVFPIDASSVNGPNKVRFGRECLRRRIACTVFFNSRDIRGMMDSESPHERLAQGTLSKEAVVAHQMQTSSSHTPFSVDDILDPKKFTGSNRPRCTWHPWQQTLLSGSESDNDQNSVRGKTFNAHLFIVISTAKRNVRG